MMNHALIMLGSNSNAESNLQLAQQLIDERFSIRRTSSILDSTPVGNYAADFANKAIALDTDFTQEQCVMHFKEIEKQLGRSPQSKAMGVIPIDIDLIFWNGCQCHQDYDRFQFVKQCIDQIKEK